VERLIKRFLERYTSLEQDGGTFAINVNDEIYQSVLVPMLGEAHDAVEYTGLKR
jgi:hypothetical protein